MTEEEAQMVERMKNEIFVYRRALIDIIDEWEIAKTDGGAQHMADVMCNIAADALKDR